MILLPRVSVVGLAGDGKVVLRLAKFFGQFLGIESGVELNRLGSGRSAFPSPSGRSRDQSPAERSFDRCDTLQIFRMEFDTYELAHEAMIQRAEREFRQSLRIPKLTIVQNAGSGRFSIRRGDPSVEDGLARKRGGIRTNNGRSWK